MIEVGYGAAFLGGILSFLSPCVLPLVPPYLCYMAGISYQQLRGGTVKRGRVARAALAFIAGFGMIFMGFGATATLFGQWVTDHAQILTWVAGGLIILFGLHFLGMLRIGLLYRQVRPDISTAGPFVMGAAFAFGWTPCVGPILAAILFLAGGQETVVDGIVLLGLYALGLGLPFMLAALFTEQFTGMMSRMRSHMAMVEKISGLLLVGTGVLFISGGMIHLAYWILQLIPALGRIG